MFRKLVWLIALGCNVLAGLVAVGGFFLVGKFAGGDATGMGASMAVMAGAIPMFYAMALSVIPTCFALCFDRLARD